MPRQVSRGISEGFRIRVSAEILKDISGCVPDSFPDGIPGECS